MWQPGKKLEDIEREVILAAMKFFYNNKTRAAESLGISIRTIDNKMEKYGLSGATKTEERKVITRRAPSNGVSVEPVTELPEKQAVSM